MSRREKPRDGFLTKVIVATVVVIWVSLVGGNWLGHYIIEQGYIGGDAKAVEFKAMPSPRPRPWVTVDPEIQKGLEEHIQKQAETSGTLPTPKPAPVTTATPLPESARADRVLPPAEGKAAAKNSPAEAAVPVPRPTSAIPAEHPEPTPTPEEIAASGDGSYSLQFGSFGSEENARRLADQLGQSGQKAMVEEIETENGKIYRVRGGSFTKEADAQGQAESLREKGIEVFIVNP
ncbi:MAG: SPOR domain-containing protein [Armatimonadetes bacterium]|nr:SPOR domain-containing protein [Armatimonadota bacterium]